MAESDSDESFDGFSDVGSDIHVNLDNGIYSDVSSVSSNVYPSHPSSWRVYVNSDRQRSHYLLASPVNTYVTRHDDVP